MRPGNWSDPTFAFRALVEDVLRDVHTCMPGRVDAVYNNDTLDVQPLLKNPLTGNDYPIIRGIPYLFSGSSYFQIVLSAGDIVLIVFSERSLDRWTPTSGSVSVEQARHFDLSDAIAIPMIYNAGVTALRKLIDERFVALYNEHVHGDPVSGYTTTPTVQITDGNPLTACKTDKVKAL